MTVNGVPVYQAKAELFKSLGHPVRIRVLELLAEREHAVHELLEQIEVEQSGLSQHLAVLRRTGLVRQQRVSGQVVYSLIGVEAVGLLTSARRLLRELVDEGQTLRASLDSDLTHAISTSSTTDSNPSGTDTDSNPSGTDTDSNPGGTDAGTDTGSDSGNDSDSGTDTGSDSTGTDTGSDANLDNDVAPDTPTQRPVTR